MSRLTRFWRRSCLPAFGMVELMVVVAVLTLLIALLIPALSIARESSRTAVCKERMRQIFVVNNSYTTENKQFIPMASEGATDVVIGSTTYPTGSLRAWWYLYTQQLDPAAQNTDPTQNGYFSLHAASKQLLCPSSSQGNVIWSNSGTTWNVVAVDSTKLAGTQYGINTSTRLSSPWSTYSVRNDSTLSAVVNGQIRWGTLRNLVKPVSVVAFGETTDNSFLPGVTSGSVPTQGYGMGVTFRHAGGTYTYYNVNSNTFTSVSQGTNLVFFDGHTEFWSFGDSLAVTDAGGIASGPGAGELNYGSGNIKSSAGKNLVSLVGTTSNNLPWQDGN